MRVLLLSCNTGEGHNSTAKAIMEVLQARGVVCELSDVLACLSPKFSKFICNWHARIYKYAPKLSDKGYRAFEKNSGEPDEYTPVYELLSFGAGKLYDMIAAGDYDAVICVHVFSGLMMTEVRRVWNVQIPCYFVATDYTCSPYVDHCEMDGYFIPGDELVQEFAETGLPEKRLIPSGIPVRQCFYSSGSKGSAREKLALPADGFVVLLMCGSMGCGPMRKIAKSLSERLPEGSTVVVICGRNERLYESMEDLAGSRLRLLGYTKNVENYMDAADMIVTKPGGLSATEAANKHLPMVFINAVGGCEGKNFTHFLARGYAVGSKEPEEVLELTLELAKRPDRLAQMEQTLREAFTKNSAAEIAERVITAGNAYREYIQAAGEQTAPAAPWNAGSEEIPLFQTAANLARSFAIESQAHGRYGIYAQVAREEGLEWIARLFEDAAANEAAHARLFRRMLRQIGGCSEAVMQTAGYLLEEGDTAANLTAAARDEMRGQQELYPTYAQIARQEGFPEAAQLWMQIVEIETVQYDMLRILQERMRGGALSMLERPIVWRCLNCGYAHRSTRAADACPVCGKGAGWQEAKLDWRKFVTEK